MYILYIYIFPVTIETSRAFEIVECRCFASKPKCALVADVQIEDSPQTCVLKAAVQTFGFQMLFSENLLKKSWLLDLNI